jgi:ubiquitin-like-conjugating enzyme ATG3
MAFLKRTAFSVAEYFTPVLTTSQFYKTGQLTPEEYVLSGDQLTSKCSSWHWGRATDANMKDFLPKDKQYLYTKSVPCLARVLSITGMVLDEAPAEDEWVLTTKKNTEEKDDKNNEKNGQNPENDEKNDTALGGDDGDDGDGDDDDDIPDLDDLDYGDLGEAEDATTTTTTTTTTSVQSTTTTTTTATTATNTNKKTTNPITGVRSYDISIVYDKLYRCPRVYLQGYDSNGKPLTEEQVQQDISGDHMNKTVTWEQHPYTNVPCMSVHPCQHAHTMKRMLEIMVDEESELVRLEQKKIEKEEAEEKEKKAVLGAIGGQKDVKNSKKLAGEKEIIQEAWIRVQGRMTVDKSLFLFLKFVATVIPTIDYDNTINFDIF